jgi:hypothetical protein
MHARESIQGMQKEEVRMQKLKPKPRMKEKEATSGE